MNKKDSLILVDSSLWIIALKDRCPETIKQLVGDLLEKDIVATCGLIIVEILQECKNKKEYNDLSEELNALHYLETNKEVWNTGEQLAYNLRRKGITIPTVDLFIASLAIYYDSTLYHSDHHFEMIANNSSLKSKQITLGI
jgi:predicted nucleic acid-binding protein